MVKDSTPEKTICKYTSLRLKKDGFVFNFKIKKSSLPPDDQARFGEVKTTIRNNFADKSSFTSFVQWLQNLSKEVYRNWKTKWQINVSISNIKKKFTTKYIIY